MSKRDEISVGDSCRSDEEIGWQWPYHMSKYHEVWVLVRKDRREGIERYCSENDIRDIHFVYCDVPGWMNFYYRNKQKGKNKVIDFLAYQFLWQFPAYSVAKKLNSEIDFDIVHHVSTNDFRLIGFLYKLQVPYIIGPIGGAQETPMSLKYYVREHKNSERFRSILNYCMIRLPGYKKALNAAAKVFFSNQETLNYLLPFIKNPQKCELLTEVGYAFPKQLLEVKQDEVDSDIPVFMWAGRMEYRKGLELLVDSLKRLPLSRPWKVILCGDGSDKEHIQRLCKCELFADRIEFMGRLSREEVLQLYKTATAFVFPSLRETTGTVIIEAMAQGVPVICLKQGGGALVVDEETGFLVPIDNWEECIAGFARAMIQCMDNPTLVAKKGKMSQKKVMDRYSWEKKISDIECCYRRIVNNGGTNFKKSKKESDT